MLLLFRDGEGFVVEHGTIAALASLAPECSYALATLDAAARVLARNPRPDRAARADACDAAIISVEAILRAQGFKPMPVVFVPGKTPADGAIVVRGGSVEPVGEAATHADLIAHAERARAVVMR